ncbi:U-box domain-containing protein 21-like [Typha latifolia]|uniref:U-box domain-containing protein 21-like n=1 Tax=Typha latifolia TaxID=4733 RepID=UPI003C2F1FDD
MSSTRRTSKLSPKVPLLKRIHAGGAELSVPTHFRCPISLDLMRDPVIASTGITYDRQSIESWLDRGNGTCPVTGVPIRNEDLIPNHSLRRMIQEWCVANRALGVERIPTPRIPVNPMQVSEILSGISSSSRRGDGAGCVALTSKVKSLGKESERNRRCITSGGAGRVLAASFRDLGGESIENSRDGALEEILSALVCFLPLDEEAKLHIGSPGSLKSIVSILRCGKLAGRLNSVLVLKELVSTSDSNRLDAVAKTNGLIEALVKLVEKPISPQTTKASLVTAFYLVSSNERIASKFVEFGLVPLLLEILVDSEKSMSEKALAVLDGLLSCKRGRQSGLKHALMVPILVKKMFRVSDMATEFAVSALWKLCKNGEKEELEERREAGEGCLVEALQVGAFQKLLLLLQVGCCGTTKEKASELLKLLNASRASVECIESVDFKGLKRPF